MAGPVLALSLGWRCYLKERRPPFISLYDPRATPFPGEKARRALASELNRGSVFTIRPPVNFPSSAVTMQFEPRMDTNRHE